MINPAIKRAARAELARRDFWEYCHLMGDDFYKADRDYLKALCRELQDFLESDESVMIVNAPPRHGKSRTATMLCQWLLGKDPTKKIMTGSYNETLSETFSKAVRNAIDTQPVDPDVVTFREIFPGVRIKRGDGAVTRWSLEGQHASYLATSPTGTATGFGADVMIIDDLIKSALEANNELVLDKHWQWFIDTMLSRLEGTGKIIIMMTRWHTQDLAGKAESHYMDIGQAPRVVKFKALQDAGNMLCEGILSREQYKMRLLSSSPEIVRANYQQEPIDVEGQLYKRLKTYANDIEFEEILNYTDTADEGSDFLCSICYGVKEGEAYIVDVLYTQEGMENTEPATAAMLHSNHVHLSVIESNNGGRGFARNVERLLWETHKSRKPSVKWFHQSKNKMARILSASTFVMDHVYFPEDWRKRWPEFYHDVNRYQRLGKNKHDDAPDALSGIAERFDRKHKLKAMKSLY